VALLAGGLPALALARPPADPVVIVVNTGSGGLALLTDPDGRWLAIGGSTARTGAAVALDRQLPAWERSLGLLLVPPPHAAHVPGALEILDRRSVGRASLLGLSPRPQAALERWAARRSAEPVTAPAEVALAGGGRLWLDPGDDPSGGGALALIERGEVRLLLLFGEAAALAETRHVAGRLPRPLVAGQLTRAATPLPTGLSPPLLLTLDGANAVGPPRTLALGAGQTIRLTLQPDRLRLEGEMIESSVAVSRAR